MNLEFDLRLNFFHELIERGNTTRSTEAEIISYCENKPWQDGETERKYRKKTNWDGR